jgi:hypothetical protein
VDHETGEPCTDSGPPAFSSAALSAFGDRRTHASVDAVGVVLAPGMTGPSVTNLRYMRTCVVSWADPIGQQAVGQLALGHRPRAFASQANLPYIVARAV